MSPSILALMDGVFAEWFKGATWNAWRAFLAALFALTMTEDQLATYRRHTGRSDAPARRFREAALICGRRGGKSRIAALVAVFLAVFVDYSKHLAPGERGVVMVLASDRRQARTIFGYVEALFDQVPTLAQLVTSRTQSSLELSNRLTIEIHTASFRSVRGYTVVAALCDEVAFWAADDGSANPDTEILKALRPAMATIPNALLLMLSSPYARRGVLWEANRKHFGVDGAPVLVWNGSTEAMNPAVDPQIIRDAFEEDPVSAASEHGSDGFVQFRSDVEAFIAREAVEAVVITGRKELPPAERVSYHAFVDPSGGSQDSMTLAIAHTENGVVVLDCLRERRPPFNPDDVVGEFAATLRAYRVLRVVGDAFGGIWVRDAFSKVGVTYVLSDRAKSECYRESLPVINAKRVQLLDDPKLIAQLCGLERRVARGGRDSIDHAPGGHDDTANAACGVIATLLGSWSGGFGMLEWFRREAEKIAEKKAAGAA